MATRGPGEYLASSDELRELPEGTLVTVARTAGWSEDPALSPDAAQCQIRYMRGPDNRIRLWLMGTIHRRCPDARHPDYERHPEFGGFDDLEVFEIPPRCVSAPPTTGAAIRVNGYPEKRAAADPTGWCA